MQNEPRPQPITHTSVRGPHGILLPWAPWHVLIEREMNWYLKCPVEHGYPRLVYTTFLDGNYDPFKRSPSFIPCTQNGMGIISYLKYYAYSAKANPKVLEFARAMGDYLVKETLTPETGKYPRFTRSTGWRAQFPFPPDCGSQADKPYEIEPDKGGIAGFALILLYEETKDRRYFDQALQNARVLSANMRDGDATRSPWPFRVDYRTGAARGEVSGNMSFILRLFDTLIEHGQAEFRAPRERLWKWILEFQIPNLAKDGLLWVQFFEDHEELDNRIAWSPLNLARYFIEKKEALHADWKRLAKVLIDFVNRWFVTVRNGVAVCGEQTYDVEPWSGVLSNYGGVLAMYASATGTRDYEAVAYQALNYVLYGSDDDGCPADRGFDKPRGGWQEDAHTDKIHNFMDAIAAFPEWAK